MTELNEEQKQIIKTWYEFCSADVDTNCAFYKKYGDCDVCHYLMKKLLGAKTQKEKE